MPQIRAAIERRGPLIVQLPVPRLLPDHLELTAGITQRQAVLRRMTGTEMRSAVVPDMIEELQARGLESLVEMLKQPRPRRR